MIRFVRPAVVLTLLFTGLTGLAYPLVMTGIAQAVFPAEAGGSLIRKTGGTVQGSALIGQAFTQDRYFWPRHSATSGSPYNAVASGGSNLGPTSKALVDRIRADADRLGASSERPVPVDLVTASASGLDPDLSPAAALYQVPRVAKARGLDETTLRRLVEGAAQPRLLGILGEPHVNVLALNLALDAVGR
jgi:potassium-transporting ATPase KdpC subunit